MWALLGLNRKIEIKGLYTYSYREHGSDFRTPGEKHDFWELVYVDSGEIYAGSGNDRYILSQGNVIFHKPMEFHSVAAVNGKPHNILVATFETSSPSMDFFIKKIFTLNLKQKKLLAAFLEECKAMFGSGMYCTEQTYAELKDVQQEPYQIAVAYLEIFLLELMRESNAVKRTSRENPVAKKNIDGTIVDSIKLYMQENLYCPLTLNEICAHFHMSKSYICQLFKNETGCSIIDYFIDLKIKEAKLLIREGELNFTQIAEKLGYTSLHHFTRIFKSRVKMSPSSYEKSIKGL